jgi:predicted RNA-binding protein
VREAAVCLATVYVETAGEREEVMHDVAWIRPQSGGLQLITFLGESRLLQAEIKSVDLVNGRIILEEGGGYPLELPEEPRGDG